MTCSFPPFCALPQASRTRIKELRWLLLSLKRNSLFSAQNTWSTFFFFKKPFMQISLKIHCSRTFTQRVLLFRFWPLPSISQRKRSDSKFYNAQISFLPNHSLSNVFMWTPPTQVWLVMVVKNERQAQETGFCFIFEKESMNIMKKNKNSGSEHPDNRNPKIHFLRKY